MNIWKSIRPYISGAVRFFHISYIEAKSRNRGAYLGILWIPLSSLIFSATLALIFRHSDTLDPMSFFLYVLAGYVFWSLISSTITGSTDIIQTKFDFAIHNNLTLIGLFSKNIVDRLFEYFINVILIMFIMIIFSPGDFLSSILLFPAFIALTAITSFAASYIVNITVIFFPDTRSIFNVGVRFMFFASPVFWSANESSNGLRSLLVQYNPAAYYLSLSRQVFGISPIETTAWVVCLAISAVLCLTGYIAYRYSHAFVRNLK